jgi:hypothetical protein
VGAAPIMLMSIAKALAEPKSLRPMMNPQDL